MKAKQEDPAQKNSQMELFLKVNGKIPNSKLECASILMVKLLKVNGKTENLKVQAKKPGLMDGYTKVLGFKESPLVKAQKLISMEPKRRVSGLQMFSIFMMINTLETHD